MSKRNIAKITIKQQATWLVVFAAVSMFYASTSVAQTGYYQQQYAVQASAPPPARIARALPRANPFPAVYADPPAPLAPVSSRPRKFAALSKTFAASKPKTATPSGRVQDVFGGNRFKEAFGEEPGQTARPNPFKKVDPQEGGNPFGEVRSPSDPQNPFGELPDDPSPSVPPMDTRPVRPPTLPRGFEFTPNPSLINPNPPKPGQEDPVLEPRPSPRDTEPRDTDPRRVEEPDVEDPVEVPRNGEDVGELARDEEQEGSVFDRVDPPDDEDLPPVPQPNSSRVYLPAKKPTDYVNPDNSGSGRRPYPPGYDPRDYARNPYAGLPGPYGYATPPGFPPGFGGAGFGAPGFVPPGFVPYPVAVLPVPQYGQFGQYGQCGPGCQPISAGNGNAPTFDDTLSLGFPCDACDRSRNGGCGPNISCSNRNRPQLAQTTRFGERIVETGVVDGCDSCYADETYTDAVSDCDSICSNYASAYVSLFGGWSGVNDFITRGDIGEGVFFEDSGGVFGVALGQIQGRNLRTELELSYRNIDINGLRLEGSVPSEFLAVNGDFGTFAGMLNAYWEFVDFGVERVKPYFGAGVGFALARPELFQGSGAEAAIDNDDSSFAWQLMAGLNYKASPTLDAFVEYRYFVAESFSLDTEIPAVAGLGDGSGRFDYQSSNVIFGLRARF